MLSLGLALTLLGVTGLTAHGPLAALTVVAVCLAAGLCSLDRRILIVSAPAVAVGVILWFMFGGAGVLTEVVNGLILHMSGLTAALPLVGGSFTVLVSLLCVFVGWMVTVRSAGPWPALLLLVAGALLMWLGGFQSALWQLLPAVLGCILLLLRSGDEDTSTFRVLPLALVITMIGYCGVWAGGVTYEPLKELAAEIRQRIYDTFFFTGERDAFSLAAEGYYPQGRTQLGGPAEPHTDPVMAVVTNQRAYLRGAVMNEYTGRNWADTVRSRRYLWQSANYRDLRAAAFDENLPLSGQGSELLRSSRITVRMLGGSASSLFTPQRLRMLRVEGDIVPYFNTASEVFTTRNLVIGDEWGADAPLMTSRWADLKALVDRAYDENDPNWASVRNTYLQLPADGHGKQVVDERVAEMARAATEGISSAYGQALAIQDFLSSRYQYTLDAPEQNPNQDFVSTFLLVEKRGYCVHFASAMTVMCRLAGLPARYVEGYVALPDDSGISVVTGEQGHAWTEVYFRGFGWVTFDATPGGIAPQQPDEPLPPQDSPNDQPTSTPEATDSPSPTPEPTPTPSPVPDDLPGEESLPSPSPSPVPSEIPQPDQDEKADESGFTWLLLLLLALIGRTVWVQPAVRAALAKDELHTWLAWVQAAHDALRVRGLKRQSSESPGAFLSRAEREGGLPVSLSALSEAESSMFYGHMEPTPDDVAHARDISRALMAKLTLRQKALFHLQRIALPARMHDVTR